MPTEQEHEIANDMCLAMVSDMVGAMHRNAKVINDEPSSQWAVIMGYFAPRLVFSLAGVQALMVEAATEPHLREKVRAMAKQALHDQIDDAFKQMGTDNVKGAVRAGRDALKAGMSAEQAQQIMMQFGDPEAQPPRPSRWGRK
jgi:hypothetical protein